MDDVVRLVDSVRGRADLEDVALADDRAKNEIIRHVRVKTVLFKIISLLQMARFAELSRI
jgi:hypothetical protein